ncbi:hypothetical protein [Novosphingobium huizhouense]|uniref:hypothetical protein n=1 Tax=Novosphingobium huizhouense TaxID=2866625 RepID=UPI001CD8BB49|nr:hypothetical protein [Novosphingobium huizhouense]
MAMTNAERQRRYRQRLKARASGAALPEQARDAVERAIVALWAFHERPSPQGLVWSDIDGCTTIDQYRSDLERNPGNLIQACRAFLPDFVGLTPEEAQAVATVIALADALRLAPPRTMNLPRAA